MQKWEYLIETIYTKNQKMAEVLNSLGEKGWELLTLQTSAFRGDWEHFCIFKRPKP
jgi:hypothetical protein